MPLSALTPAPVMYNRDIYFPSNDSELTQGHKAFAHLQKNFYIDKTLETAMLCSDSLVPILNDFRLTIEINPSGTCGIKEPYKSMVPTWLF